MRKFSLLLLLLGSFLHAIGQDVNLFPMVVNNKVGYIDLNGKVVIKPVFRNGGEFSEGLAPVRKDGLYGYINTRGEFVIKPKYDLARTFRNGLAEAFVNGKCLIINQKGQLAFPPNIVSVTFLAKGKAIIRTSSGREGCIDLRTKKMYIDTAFGAIGEFSNGIAIVRKYTGVKRNEEAAYAAINEQGRFIVPFDHYAEINDFANGYAIVKVDRDGKEFDGLIDTKGSLIFLRSRKDHTYVMGGFQDGFATISLYKYWIPEKERVLYTTEKMYEGYIDLNGKVVFNDTTYVKAGSFKNRRAVIKKQSWGGASVINTKFKKIGGPYKDVLNDSFDSGYAAVHTEEGWGIIDTNCKFVVKPQYDKITKLDAINKYFVFKTDSTEDLYGIANFNGKILVKPIIESFDDLGFRNGLLKATIDGKFTYLNKLGMVVWQEREQVQDSVSYLNVDFMNRGYFTAYSTPKKNDDDGGWAVSQNVPKKDTLGLFDKNELVLRIDTTKKQTFADAYHGYTLFLANTTGDTVTFNAQDSRLYMKLQAQDAKGEWKDIEHLPSSWCGNSYHKLKLEPNTYWSFAMPQYTGQFKTNLRAELKYIDKTDLKKTNVVYSNVITGSINPGQFWNKQPYTPKGIMDPYLE